MNFFYQYEPKSISCRRLETKRHSDRNGDFGFRREAQVRTYLQFNFIRPYRMQRRHHQGEEETKARAKNGIPLPPDGFSSAHLFLEPLFPTVFYPPTFCLPPETELLSSICTFFYSYVYRFGLHSVLLFGVLWLISEQFYKSVRCLVLSNFMGDIKYMLFVWLSYAVGIC